MLETLHRLGLRDVNFFLKQGLTFREKASLRQMLGKFHQRMPARIVRVDFVRPKSSHQNLHGIRSLETLKQPKPGGRQRHYAAINCRSRLVVKVRRRRSKVKSGGRLTGCSAAWQRFDGTPKARQIGELLFRQLHRLNAAGCLSH